MTTTEGAIRRRSTDIYWPCDACHQPISDQAGYLHIAHADIQAARVVYSAPIARWQVHHATCDHQPLAESHLIDVGRVRTHAQLLQRTATLMVKPWLECTDWAGLIARVTQNAAEPAHQDGAA